MSKKPKKSLIKTITKTIRNSYRDSFVSKKESEDDMDRQADATAKVLELMRDFGDTGEGTRKIEFFFYASRIEKAHILANQLRQLDYDLEVVNSADSDQQFLINGWTTPMKTDDDIMISWAEQMSNLGSNCDCKFDGWGTFMDL